MSDRQAQHPPLKRLLGARTALLIGMGVAIGSGIFRTPGDVAGPLQIPWLIVATWVLGGVIVLMQGMVTAELATRFPQAGGEYVFLREAYGEFFAFFFGWAYTVFVIGGGASAIALAFGDFAAELLQLDAGRSGLLAAGAIVAITAVNSIGLKAGAGAQNVLTCIKIFALLAVIAIGFTMGGRVAEPDVSTQITLDMSGLKLYAAAVLPVLWAYSGTTDSVKLAEEIKDVRRALPRAIIGSTVILIVIYACFNIALMRVVPPAEMAGLSSVPGEAMSRLFGATGRNAMLLAAMLVCLGSLSSTVLATIRVTFALARDGLAFRFMGRMSKRQAPVSALVVVGAFAVVLVLNRNFTKVLQIYFFASAILFGLSYATLIVFRLRESKTPANVFRCPFGIATALFVILFQVGLAINIAMHNPTDVLYTLVILAVVALLYLLWKRFTPPTALAKIDRENTS